MAKKVTTWTDRTPKPKPPLTPYETGYADASKAFGGCTKCYGKGYATTLAFIEGAEDFGGDGTPRRKLPEARPCSCDRGKQIDRLLLAAQNRELRIIV